MLQKRSTCENRQRCCTPFKPRNGSIDDFFGWAIRGEIDYCDLDEHFGNVLSVWGYCLCLDQELLENPLVHRCITDQKHMATTKHLRLDTPNLDINTLNLEPSTCTPQPEHINLDTLTPTYQPQNLRPMLSHNVFEHFPPPSVGAHHFLQLSAPLACEPGRFTNNGTSAPINVVNSVISFYLTFSLFSGVSSAQSGILYFLGKGKAFSS
jgi:hypothetical protein